MTSDTSLPGETNSKSNILSIYLLKNEWGKQINNSRDKTSPWFKQMPYNIARKCRNSQTLQTYEAGTKPWKFRPWKYPLPTTVPLLKDDKKIYWL